MSKRFHISDRALARQDDDVSLKRLREVVNRFGGITSVATMADIPVSTMSGYIYGREMKLSAAVKIARVCSVSLEWLAGITEHPHSTTFTGQSYEPLSIKGPRVENAVVEQLPFYDAASFLQSGNAERGNFETEQVSITEGFLDKLDAKAETSFILKISGDSMEPTLRDGDLVLSETTPNEAVFGLIVLMIKGRMTVRRVAYSLAGGATLIADNKLYPSQDIDSDQLKWGDPNSEHPAVIIGRVIYRFQAI